MAAETAVKMETNGPNPVKAAAGAGAKAGGLPSFSELLWCPDVDGDVMTQGIGGAMVSP